MADWERDLPPWEPCGDCECGLPFREIERMGDGFVAMCPLDRRSDVTFTEEEARALARENAARLREAVKETGDG